MMRMHSSPTGAPRTMMRTIAAEPIADDSILLDSWDRRPAEEPDDSADVSLISTYLRDAACYPSSRPPRSVNSAGASASTPTPTPKSALSRAICGLS